MDTFRTPLSPMASTDTNGLSLYLSFWANIWRFVVDLVVFESPKFIMGKNTPNSYGMSHVPLLLKGCNMCTKNYIYMCTKKLYLSIQVVMWCLYEVSRVWLHLISVMHVFCPLVQSLSAHKKERRVMLKLLPGLEKRCRRIWVCKWRVLEAAHVMEARGEERDKTWAKGLKDHPQQDRRNRTIWCLK